MTLTFDVLTLKVVSESVAILVFLGLCVLDLGPMYATDVRLRQHHYLMPPPRGRGKLSLKVLLLVLLLLLR